MKVRVELIREGPSKKYISNLQRTLLNNSLSIAKEIESIFCAFI